MKKVESVKRSNGRHWVGDGFPVRNIFGYHDIAERISPFLMLDYAGPANFAPTGDRRGVGAHPHKGFETVTIVYEGEVEHRDSSGGGGKIGPGEVQWMTAAAGIVHEEFHGTEFARRGGPFEMVQLWVNLPARDKRARPGYQGLTRDQIPGIPLPGPPDAGVVRVIAGEFAGRRGPARTFTPIQLWDMRLKAGARAEFPVAEGHTATVFVLKGAVRYDDGQRAGEAELAVLAPEGDQVTFTATADTTLLFLGGEPLREPIVGHGPFVMNTAEEIREAFAEFRSGRMGALS